MQNKVSCNFESRMRATTIYTNRQQTPREFVLAKSPRYNVYPLICSDSVSGRVPCLDLISVSVIIAYVLVWVRTRS